MTLTSAYKSWSFPVHNASMQAVHCAPANTTWLGIQSQVLMSTSISKIENHMGWSISNRSVSSIFFSRVVVICSSLLFILKLIQFHVTQMFKITWVRASPSVRGMEAARSKSERASVNTKMFRAGKFLRTNQCQYQRTLGKILTLFHPGGRQFCPHRL